MKEITRKISLVLALILFITSINIYPVYAAEDKEPSIDYSKLADGNIVVNIAGTAITKKSDELLKVINDFRKEAYANGYTNPETGNTKLSGTCKELLWSSDLELIALTRATEDFIYRSNSVNGDTKRPNGKAYNTCTTDNKIASNQEVINWVEADDGISIVYDVSKVETFLNKQKEAYVKSGKASDAPLYSKIINPNYTHVGIAGFKLSSSTNESTVATEFAKIETGKTSEKYLGKKDATTVKVELPKTAVTKIYVNEKNEVTLNKDTAVDIIPYADIKLTSKYKNSTETKDYKFELTKAKILYGATITSNNKDIVDFDKDGKLIGKAVGSATLTLVAAGITKEIKVTVKAASMKDQIKVEGFQKKLEYNMGNPVTQPDSCKLYIKDPAGNKKYLESGKDYTIEYEKNTNVGTAKVKYIANSADFAGTLTKTFKIVGIPIDGTSQRNVAAAKVIFPEHITYVKGGVKPEVTVSFNGITLEKGKDYTVSYKNANSFEGTAIIKGKKNFAKTIKVNYTIENANLQQTTMTIKDVVYKDNLKTKKAIMKPTITDVNGKKLKANKDYYKTLTYTFADTGAEVRYEDILQVGTTISVNATAKEYGHYYGTISGNYRIVEKSIAKAKVQAAKYSLDENIVPEDIIVTLEGETLIPGVDYEIQSAKLNKNGTKLTVVVHGIGRYGLTKKTTLKL